VVRRLMQVQANNDPRVPDGTFEVVCSFNSQLLAVSGGRKTLVARLVEKVTDTSLEAKGDSRITRVVNAQGHLEERHTLLQIERSLLCEVRILRRRCRLGIHMTRWQVFLGLCHGIVSNTVRQIGNFWLSSL